jgi:two-component system nitrogen regulation sensor histidine kinase NtrY
MRYTVCFRCVTRTSGAAPVSTRLGMVITNAVKTSGSGGLSGAAWLAIGMALLSLASAVYLYLTLKGLTPSNLTPPTLIAFGLVIIAMVLSLATLVAWRLKRLWSERRSGRAGARLHSRLVVTFSLVAIVPTILVAVFAAVTLNLGVESWFSSHVKDALGNAYRVAQAYEREHERGLTTDARDIVNTLQKDPEIFDWKTDKVQVGVLFTKLADMTRNHGLNASFVIDSTGACDVLDRSDRQPQDQSCQAAQGDRRGRCRSPRTALSSSTAIPTRESSMPWCA